MIRRGLFALTHVVREHFIELFLTLLRFYRRLLLTALSSRGAYILLSVVRLLDIISIDREAYRLWYILVQGLKNELCKSILYHFPFYCHLKKSIFASSQ